MTVINEGFEFCVEEVLLLIDGVSQNVESQSRLRLAWFIDRMNG